MYKNKYKLLLVGIFTMLATYYLLHTTSLAHAQQEARSLTIVPPSLSIPVNPGDKKQGILKVVNNGPTPITFTVSTQDFIVKDTIGTPDFLPQDTLGKPYSAASWIGVLPSTFTINPRQTIQLQYYLQVPQNSRPGGHYAAVLYTPTQVIAGKGSGPAVQTEVGTLFSLDVSGPIHEQAKVVHFYSNPFQEYGPVYIHTQILNLGDLHIKPIGSIRITDVLGREVGVIPLGEHNIFPQAARDYLNVFGQHWMIGPFHARLIISYGRDGNLPLLAQMTFWVFPWKVAIVILLAIIALIMSYVVWKRKKQSKKPAVPPYHHQEK